MERALFVSVCMPRACHGGGGGSGLGFGRLVAFFFLNLVLRFPFFAFSSVGPCGWPYQHPWCQVLVLLNISRVRELASRCNVQCVLLCVKLGLVGMERLRVASCRVLCDIVLCCPQQEARATIHGD